MKTISYKKKYRQLGDPIVEPIRDFIADELMQGDETPIKTAKAIGVLCQILADKGLLDAAELMRISDQEWMLIDVEMKDES
jgi:hypothetical protein